MPESNQHSEQALDIARKLVARDAETPPERRRIEVGRGGLMLLATRLINLEEQLEALLQSRSEVVRNAAHLRSERDTLLEQLETLRLAGHAALTAWQWNRRDIASAMTDLAVALDQDRDPASVPLAGQEGASAPSACAECGRDLRGYRGPRCRYCDGTAV